MKTPLRRALLTVASLSLLSLAPAARTDTLFETDFSNSNIYQFTPGGIRSTFATGLSNPEGLAFEEARPCEQNGLSKTSIPAIARLLGVRVGYNGQAALERRFDLGKIMVGGHPNSNELWYTLRPRSIIQTDGFNLNSEGYVIEYLTWHLEKRAEKDIPVVRRLPRHAGWLGTVYLGMTKQQVVRRTQNRLPAPTKQKDVWTWKAKGYVRPSPVNQDVYRTWTASLTFQAGRLTRIAVDCD